MQKLDAHPDFGWGRQLKEAGVFEEARWFFEQLESQVVPNIAGLLKSFRSQSMPVFHVRIVHQGLKAQDGTRHHRRWQIRCAPNTEEAEFLEELKPERGEYVFEKVGTSPFNSTGIDQILRNLGVEQLVICGVNTSSCVYLTVRDAIDRGYVVFLPDDACCALAGKQEHDEAIARLVGVTAVPIKTKSLIGSLREVTDHPTLKVV